MSEGLDLDEIQGNVLAGFNKDFASFLFFILPPDQQEARGWLGEILDEVATTTEVRAFNDLFRMIRARHHLRETVEATWMNLAFTYSGLQALGLAQTDLDMLPQEFKEGMRARAANVGDVGENAPVNWPANLGNMPIHALMIVASDRADDRNDEVAHFVRQAARHDVVLVFQQDGMTRRDAPGHEHFGFKDGISQPGIAGFTENPTKGQDLIAAGEFVLGYPGQPGAPRRRLVSKGTRHRSHRIWRIRSRHGSGMGRSWSSAVSPKTFPASRNLCAKPDRRRA